MKTRLIAFILAALIASPNGVTAQGIVPLFPLITTPPIALTDAASISIAVPGQSPIYTYEVTLGGNHNFANPTGFTSGQQLNFIITENTTGGYTLGFGSDFNWVDRGVSPSLNLAANSKTLISCVADTGSSLQCVGGIHNDTTLLGVNVSGAEFAPWNGQQFPASSDFAYLASKGVTFIRFPIAWESIQPTLLSALNATYLGNLKTAIANAYENHIGVIVDLHNFGAYCQQANWTSSGCGYAGNGGNTGTGVNFLGDGTLTQSDFVDLWTRLSTALVGTPGLIGYDLMNEPAQSLIQYGTNLLYAPNGFGDGVGSQPWFATNGSVATQLVFGTNSLGSNYGPAWTISSGSGFGAVCQQLTLNGSAYNLDVYAKVPTGTATGYIQLATGSSTTISVTTSWQRFTYSASPSAGAQSVCLGVNTATPGVLIEYANAQVVTGSSEVAYVPNPWLPYAQAAITAIRAVDAATPIYVGGYNASTAYTWPWVNWDLATLTGANLVYEAHNYFDGSVSQGGGGGTYSGNYTSYGITSSAGVQEVAPFENWVATNSLKGYLGEYAIPNSTADNNAAWFPLMDNFLQSLLSVKIPSSMWFIANGIQSANNLNVSSSTSANAGNDDPRLLSMIAQ